MDGMEEKLNAILGNPQMMQQIMAMAQAMGQQSAAQPPKEEPKQDAAAPMGGLDIGMIQKISGIARQSGIDKDQQNLLKALGPYLSRERITKLEKQCVRRKLPVLLLWLWVVTEFHFSQAGEVLCIIDIFRNPTEVTAEVVCRMRCLRKGRHSHHRRIHVRLLVRSAIQHRHPAQHHRPRFRRAVKILGQGISCDACCRRIWTPAIFW